MEMDNLRRIWDAKATLFHMNKMWAAEEISISQYRMNYKKRF